MILTIWVILIWKSWGRDPCHGIDWASFAEKSAGEGEQWIQGLHGRLPLETSTRGKISNTRTQLWPFRPNGPIKVFLFTTGSGFWGVLAKTWMSLSSAINLTSDLVLLF